MRFMFYGLTAFLFLRPLYFSSPKMPAAAPVPQTPTEDAAKVREREIAAQAAAVEAANSGRRSTIFAGKELDDESFSVSLGGARTRRGGSRRGAAADLGSL